MVHLALLRDGCEDTSRSEESSNEIIPDSDSSPTNELSEESQKLRLLEWLREENFDNRDTDGDIMSDTLMNPYEPYETIDDASHMPQIQIYPGSDSPNPIITGYLSSPKRLVVMTNCILPEELVSRNGSDNHIELQKENMENISSKSDLLVSKHCIESRASTCYSSIDDPGELSQENIEEASSDSSIIPLGNRISSRKKHHPPEEDFSPCSIISDSSNELRNENLNDESVLTEQASNLNISSVHDPVVPETYSEMKATAIQSKNTTYRFISETLTKSKKKRTVCKFCELEVTNFERHLCRHHADAAVQDYLSFPKTTKDGRQMRREILALLRYESDFKIFVQNENELLKATL
nr:unnamed protein product [Callosobruchus analis]